MKRTYQLFVLLLLLTFVISGCNTKETTNLFEWQDSYVGDNSAVGNIVSQLPAAEHFKDFELQTTDKPYGMKLNYEPSMTEENVHDTVLYNATYLFALVQNADWIIFDMEDQTYELTREALQDWYGENLTELESEAEIEKLIQSHPMNEQAMEQLF